MIKADTHIINRQVFHLHMNEKENFQHVEEVVKQRFYNYLMPVLEQVLNKYGSANTFILIDKLKIDIGSINITEPFDSIINRFKLLVEEELKSKIKDLKSIKKLDSNNQTEEILPGKLSTEKPIKLTKDQAVIKAFYKYLQTGNIDTWISINSYFEFEKLVFDSSQELVNNLQNFINLGKANPQIYYRLVLNFSDGFVQFVLSLNQQVKNNFKKSGLKDFYAFLTDNKAHIIKQTNKGFYYHIKSVFVKIALESISAQEVIYENITKYLTDIPKSDLFIHFTINSYLELSGVKHKDIPSSLSFFVTDSLFNYDKKHNFIPQEHNKKTDTGDYKKKLTKQASNLADEEEKEASKPLSDTDEISKTFKESQTEEKPVSLNKEIINQLFKLSNDNEIEEEYYYIQNAGMVLLSPYLEMYFKELGLVQKNNSFVDNFSIERAIHNIHYLCFGNTTPIENILLFNKILCGISMHTPIDCNYQLSSKEKKEADSLLKAVIRNWPALKNTSPAGLREGFLQRKGKIIKSDNRWNLHVEQNAVDVLLSSLPWTISIVELPWMGELIYTYWT